MYLREKKLLKQLRLIGPLGKNGVRRNFIRRDKNYYQRTGGGNGMGMATQLELISVYACCSTRAVMRYMEGGDIVPYVRSLPTKTGP